jgi:hypothetical protein
LIDQFMRPSANVRTDGYGGPVENRTALNAADRATFYDGGAEGYTDYTSLEAADA